jgi:DNA-binding response OmpR family regulator
MPTVERARILVVEDEAKVADAIRAGLAAEGYDVVVARTGERGLSCAREQRFEMIVLDWMLPGRSGLEVLAALRGEERLPPVLLLTARDALEDRVAGLDAGADDYLMKPFAFPELLARTRALLRRDRSEPRSRRVADLELDPAAHRALRGGRRLELTLLEFELLDYLLRHRDRVVSREMLAREVWKEPARAATLDNVIDVTIARLRRKVDGDAAAKLIHTVRGIGFVLREQSP